MDLQAGLKPRVEMEAWATPAPGTTLADLLAHFAEIGQVVLAVDEINNRVLVAVEKGGQ